LGPRFGTPIWDPDLGPRFGTSIWDPDLGPRFGTPIWDPDLGPRFGTPIWDPNLGPQFGTPIWDPDHTHCVQHSAKNPNAVVSVQLKIQIKTKCQIFVSVETQEIIVQQNSKVISEPYIL
jgi:hypothetical protein